jgi:hypothetical protein
MRTRYENIIKLLKNIIPICLTVVMLIIVYKYFIQDINNSDINKLYKRVKSPVIDTLNQNSPDINGEGLKSVYEFAHNMTNGLIRADAIWAVLPMDKINIDKLYRIVNYYNIPNKDTLLGIIDKWKKCDFNDIVQDHNYFWNILKGTVGEAYGENEDAIEKATRKIQGK